jgi:hypothetical protein
VLHADSIATATITTYFILFPLEKSFIHSGHCHQYYKKHRASNNCTHVSSPYM